MPRFIEGLLLVFMIFGFCIGFAIIIKITMLWIIEQRKPNEEVKREEPKIYLIKQTEKPKPTKKKRQRRSPKIAFKGIVLKPESVTVKNEDS